MASRTQRRGLRVAQTQTLHAVQAPIAARQDNHWIGQQSGDSQMTKLEGAALEKRNRSIAANTIYEARRARNVHDRPVTDHEAGIQEMVYKLLLKLEATEDVSEDGNRIVPAHQPATRPELLNVEKLLADIQAA